MKAQSQSFSNHLVKRTTLPMIFFFSEVHIYILVFVSTLIVVADGSVTFEANSRRHLRYPVNTEVKSKEYLLKNGICSSGNGYVPWAWSNRKGSPENLILKSNCSIVAMHFRECLPNFTEKTVTLALLYYRDATFLNRQFSAWQLWPRDILRAYTFLIVDDGSPTAERATLVHNMHGMDVMYYRIVKDIAWNIGGARNLVFTVAKTEFVLMMDCDLLVPSTMALSVMNIVSLELEKGVTDVHRIYYKFNRILNTSRIERIHPAAMLLSKKAYWKCGGCDEDFVGHYGSTDPHFKWRASRTPGVLMVDVRKYTTEYLVQMEDAYGVASGSRSTAHNKKLLREKMDGTR